METISVQKRDLTLKARKMRRLGMIPGNVFGKSLSESVSIQMDTATARRLIRQKRVGSKLSLNIESQMIPVQIKEVSFSTISNEILHIGFQALSADKKVNSVIHVLLSKDEKISGQLEKMLLEIPYSSLPEDMIDTITIDLDGLKSGTVLTVKDISELMNEKIELQADLDEIVLRINDRKPHVPTPSEE